MTNVHLTLTMRSWRLFCSSCRHNCAICWISNFVLSVLPAT